MHEKNDKEVWNDSDVFCNMEITWDRESNRYSTEPAWSNPSDQEKSNRGSPPSAEKCRYVDLGQGHIQHQATDRIKLILDLRVGGLGLRRRAANTNELDDTASTAGCGDLLPWLCPGTLVASAGELPAQRKADAAGRSAL
ncbi:hypothetical protein LNV09_20535 [Paucibacter sp. B2R-40]|uniref:hypothetical protein n=1 Tax=Paucibacter sp. B2R-40 TaxID=2893554 RepID=UPI0021E4AC84|nr:hypothetical protein [Paucibacter sp. B2R-40]MCV2356535.1 hypothetical protein [Paucibacter sp. B2R-40]